MPTVHPTAVLEGDVHLADDVVIGPHCVVQGEEGPVHLGAGTRVIGNAWLTGPLTIGEGNTIYPFACIGFPPQDLKWNPQQPSAGVSIGTGNTIREHVTVHRATSDDTPTRIGNENYLMASSHIAHDCCIANNCILANSTLLGGFAQIDDRVITGGNAGIHQFCRVGRGAMLSGGAGMTQDVPPYFMLTATNLVGSINLIGLRRSHTPADVIDDVRWTYRTLYRRGLSLTSALAEMRTRSDRPMISEYLSFITNAKRGICRGLGKAARATSVEDQAALAAAEADL